MSNQFLKLNSEDVISVKPENFERLEVPQTFTVKEIVELLEKYIACTNKTDTKFFTAGMEAKVLRPGESWKQGKIRIGVEFCQEPTPTEETEVTNNSHSNRETVPLNN
jgi:hypothetical protein